MLKPAKFLVLIPLAYSLALGPGPVSRSEVLKSLETPSPISRTVQRAYLLPALLSAEVESLNPSSPAVLNRRLQIGARRALQPAVQVDPRTVAASDWTVLADGTRQWAVAITSQGGLGIRVHLENVSLPAEARIVLSSLSNPGSPSVKITGKELGSQREIWTETIFGEQLQISCLVPSTVDLKSVTFTIKEISHLYVLPGMEAHFKEGSCHNDVTCYGNWATEASGVARISFVEHGNTFLCSGCLLASQSQTGTQFFLTANHCVPNQTVASTIEFFWFYQTSSCNGPPPDLSSAAHTSGGADRLAGSGNSDFAFLRLKHAAAAGAASLGWSTDAPGQGETLTCIHHPDGSFKRISFGHFYDSDPDFWAVQWVSGVTEGGSSGSPLFNANHQVIGQLSGGFDGPGSSCDDPSAPDEFGRFDMTFSSISKWLTSSGGGGDGGGGTDFTGAKGPYTGLFADDSSSDPQTSAGLAAITVSSKGKFSGKLTIGARKYSMSGQFDSSGNAQVTVSSRGTSPLSVSLQVDPTGASHQINGSVSDGSFNAPLTAYRNVFNSMNPAPQAGQYTLVLPGSNGSAAPDGDGYGVVTVDRTGKVRMAGSLADGVKISQSGFVSADGRWPLYIALYSGGAGSLRGWISFSGSDSLAGDLLWTRPGLSTAKYYPGGFSLALEANGAHYTRPAAGGPVLDLENGQIVLSGGDLGQNVVDQFQIASGNKVVNLGPGKLSLSFSAANGSFSGKLADPDTGITATFHGVVLQDRNFGSGYFLGASQSGQVFVGP